MIRASTGVARLMVAESSIAAPELIGAVGTPSDLVLILGHPSAASAAGAGDHIAARGRANPRLRRWP